MAPEEFQYAVLHVVPRIERDERINAGVVVFSKRHGFLGARVGLDAGRLTAIDPEADADEIGRHLRALEAVAAGEPAGGAVAGLPQSERFHWLTAPSSTAIQPSAVHTGITGDPAATLDRLFQRLVS